MRFAFWKKNRNKVKADTRRGDAVESEQPSEAAAIPAAEKYLRELLDCIAGGATANSIPVPGPIMHLSTEVQALERLDQQDDTRLTPRERIRIWMLLGRLYELRIDHSIFSKSAERVFKYVSRSTSYLRRAYEASRREGLDPRPAAAACALMCTKQAWTLMNSTRDPVQRFFRGGYWDRFANASDIAALIAEANSLFAESVEHLPASYERYPAYLSYAGLAKSLAAVSASDHKIAADYYLAASAALLELGNRPASDIAVSAAIVGMAKAGAWTTAADLARSLFTSDWLKVGSPDSPRDAADARMTAVSDAAIALYHAGRIDESQTFALAWTAPMVSEWVAHCQSVGSIRQGLPTARERVVRIAKSVRNSDLNDEFAAYSWHGD